ncbi:hypothetical protein diail_3856 [Diaporthe ilicicola]|nr:hypothetical protein diail_3856 [Diaporthe ilicicola]
MSGQATIKDFYQYGRTTENTSVAPPATTPQATTPPTAAPPTPTAVPPTAVPPTAAPQTIAPQTAAPQTAAPQTAAPQTTAPQTAAPLSPTPPTTTSLSTSPAQKRAASPDVHHEAAHKRSRTSDDTTEDDPESAASTDEVASTEPGFPGGPLTVWAKTRSDLCDSQKLFRSYKAGAYTKDKEIYSLYINKYSEPRDFLGRAKLITCTGGGREQQDGKGPWVRSKTIKPAIVSSWEAAIDNPVVIIIGKDHPDFATLNLPSDVRSRGAFVELATFMVTKVWKEMVKPKDIKEAYPVWKVMLQTMDPASKPWYWKDDTGSGTSVQDSLSADENHTHNSIGTEATAQDVEEKECTKCGKVSPKIFDNAPWVCLQDGCENFFQAAGIILKQTGNDGKGLRYSRDFINQTTAYDEIQNIPTLFQPLPEALVEGGENYGTEVALRGGMTCPECRCCTSRKYWNRLACCNCGFEYNTAPLHYPLNKVKEETEVHTKKLAKKNGILQDGVTIKMDKDHVKLFIENDKGGMSTRFIYMIKHPNGSLIGTFVVERPSDAAKQASGGADEIYTSIEAESSNMQFQRNPARCPGSTSEILTRHFQSNFGALYDFGMKNIPTVPFKDAPDAVLKALVYLKHFGERALKTSQLIAVREKYRLIEHSTLHRPQKPFNELLALAYRESDKINWHDDGEDQLTGVISTASFGSPGLMALRFKKKTKKGEPEEIENEKKGKTVLKVQLRHGDVATMCDTRLQALTDHMVEPDGIRRYAMTSRTINFDHYSEPKQKEKLDERGLTIDEMKEAAQLPDHAKDLTYNGTKLGSHQDEAV